MCCKIYLSRKVLFRNCGVNGHKTTFLFTDQDIKEESFLEYVNNVLASGLASQIFSKDEQVINQISSYIFIVEPGRDCDRTCSNHEEGMSSTSSHPGKHPQLVSGPSQAEPPCGHLLLSNWGNFPNPLFEVPCVGQRLHHRLVCPSHTSFPFIILYPFQVPTLAKGSLGQRCFSLHDLLSDEVLG